jgi:DNA invertase Pin-like site-specific DNA recombinase
LWIDLLFWGCPDLTAKVYFLSVDRSSKKEDSMIDSLRIPAAQYLRMSTEHQQYSTENQMAVISQYAMAQGFAVVRTYSDPARSGLLLKNRFGLRELLKDVATGETPYRAILVYDVSRWGRFQDTDESAHYEFLCKSAGIPVHYCAEPFPNDGSMFSLITKNLKRLMAAEYSRELGAKVLAGQKRLAQLGFKQGAIAGYGLRRMLVSAEGQPKQILAKGERKSIATDRVVLVPGPTDEIECVRRIFRLFTDGGRSLKSIARELNAEGVPCIGNMPWTHQILARMIQHSKYAGCVVFNRHTMRLGTRTVLNPKDQWIIRHHAHEPIIDEATFKQAQEAFANLTIHQSDQKILDGLRALLAREGKLSASLIDADPDTAYCTTLRSRFGGVHRAYELIGYREPGQFVPHRAFLSMKDNLLERIQALFPDQITIVKAQSRWHRMLRLRTGSKVAVLLSGQLTRYVGTSYGWLVKPIVSQRRFVTLLARVDARKHVFIDFRVLPRMDRRKVFRLPAPNHPWWQHSERLPDLSSFCEVVKQVRARPVC